MNNMFDNAKFGDKFRTKNGSMMIYHHKRTQDNYHILIPEYKLFGIRYNDDGTTNEHEDLTIISTWPKN